MSNIVAPRYWMLYDTQQKCFCDVDGMGMVFWADRPNSFPYGFIKRSAAVAAFNRIRIKDLQSQIEIREYKVTLEEVKE